MELTWGDECFVCGSGNAEGLRLAFVVDEEQRAIETVWVPRPAHQGYRGIVHGGLVTTVLDEAMGKLSAALGMPAVTAELTVRFRKPVPPERPLRVQGRITEVRRRFLAGEAQATLEDGTVAAQATAKLMRSSL
ncbi:MAG: PaaI family thioesterase [Deferrisomatales bacterium]